MELFYKLRLLLLQASSKLIKTSPVTKTLSIMNLVAGKSMSRQAFVFLMLLLIADQNSAQTFCIPPIQPKYPDLALRAGIEISFNVQFDIVEFVPQNYRITTLDNIDGYDSSIVELFKPAIIDYLSKLCYLRDVKGFLLKLKYSMSPKTKINRGYVEKVADNEIRIIELMPKGTICPHALRQINTKIDTAIIEHVLQYKSGPERKSDILVQRFFNVEKDSILILHNNYPELEGEIYTDAKYFRKNDFLYDAPNAKYFIIRYRVVRYIESCGCSKVY
jgi:hypothetical protein